MSHIDLGNQLELNLVNGKMNGRNKKPIFILHVPPEIRIQMFNWCTSSVTKFKFDNGLSILYFYKKSDVIAFMLAWNKELNF